MRAQVRWGSDIGPDATSLRVADILAALKRLDPSRYSFTADVGDSWFIALELRTEVLLAAGYYASMGFAGPGALGAGIVEPARRPFAIVGDGAFQMTGTELATMIEQGLAPIALLLNNSSYGMLEAIDRPRNYYTRRSWDYAAMARALGASAERVTTPAELEAAMARAEANPGAFLIEAVTARDDLSPVIARIRAISTPHQSPGLFEDLVCRRPWPEAVIAGGTAPSIGPRVVGNVLDGNDRVELTAACVGHGQLPQGDSIKVSENVVRGGGQEQPGTFSQLVLELGGTPARMTQKEDDSSLFRGSQRLHGAQLGGDIDFVGDHQVRHRPAVVQGHQSAADWSAMPHRL